MPLIVSLRLLESAVRQMGADSISVDLAIDVRRGIDPIDPIDIDLKTGIEVDLSSIRAEANGVLSYKGRHVVIYIQDQSWNISSVLADGETGSKVHVSECATLAQMRKQGRFERYVATTNVSGEFYVTGQDDWGRPNEGYAGLKVCKNCLHRLNYMNFRRSRQRVFRTFEWSRFFENYKSRFTTMPTREAGELDGGYSVEWARVSKDYREDQDFRCEQCGANLRSHSRLLHVHHRSGNKRDNAWWNLEALCALCHNERHNHSMAVSSEDARLIRHLRPH